MSQNHANMSDQSDRAEQTSTLDFDRLHSELEVFELMIADYVGSITRAARLIPDDKWNWSFSERTPTAREICEHTFAWLRCDRQQIMIPGWSLHQPTPDPPADRVHMIELLSEEAQEWRKLIKSIPPELLDEERECQPGDMRLVRSFLFHMGQNVIYKAGQIWMIAFELGLDGEGPYVAPYPNILYGFADVDSWPSPRS